MQWFLHWRYAQEYLLSEEITQAWIILEELISRISTSINNTFLKSIYLNNMLKFLIAFFLPHNKRKALPSPIPNITVEVKPTQR